MHGARAISRLNHFNLNDEMLHPNDLMRLMREIALIAGKLRIQFKRHLASSDVNFPFIGPLLFAVLIIGYFDRVEAKHALLAQLDRELAEQRVAKAAALTAEVDALAQLRQQHSTLTAGGGVDSIASIALGAQTRCLRRATDLQSPQKHHGKLIAQAQDIIWLLCTAWRSQIMTFGICVLCTPQVDPPSHSVSCTYKAIHSYVRLGLAGIACGGDFWRVLADTTGR